MTQSQSEMVQERVISLMNSALDRKEMEIQQHGNVTLNYNAMLNYKIVP